MNSANGENCGHPRVAPRSSARRRSVPFKMFNRVVDWITTDRMQLINITDRINEIVRKSGIRDGMVHLQSLHTTTAVFINEWQDALLHDVRSSSRIGPPRATIAGTTTRSTPIASARTPIRTCAA